MPGTGLAPGEEKGVSGVDKVAVCWGGQCGLDVKLQSLGDPRRHL